MPLDIAVAFVGLIAGAVSAATAFFGDRRERRSSRPHQLTIQVDGGQTFTMNVQASAVSSEELATEVSRTLSQAEL